LKANKAELSKFHWVMLLIKVLPAKWDLLASAYMRKNTKVEDYKFVAFHDAMCAKWERQSRKKVLHHADKLSVTNNYFSSFLLLLTCGCLMLFILLISTQVYLQEYTSYQTHVQHVFALW
jgi:hypothetical protein